MHTNNKLLNVLKNGPTFTVWAQRDIDK